MIPLPARALLPLMSSLVLALTLGAAPALAVPTDLEIQGTLITQAGTPASGSFDLQIGIFAAETGGAALWTTTAPGVSVQGGLFEVTLQSVPPSVFDGSARWLETRVGTEPALPRRPIRSTAYAVRAGTSEVALSAQDVACTQCVGSADVGFAWAAGATKGGDAAGLECSGCVDASELAAGSVGTAAIADGSIAHADLANKYAASATAGGPASDLACSGCVAGNEIVANVVLSGNVSTTGSLLTCASGAVGCGVTVADQGGIYNAGTGFVTVQAVNGVRVRSLAGNSWSRLEAGNVVAYGATAIGSADVSQELTISSLDGLNADIRFLTPSGSVDWYASPSSTTDQSVLAAMAYPVGKPAAQVLGLRFDQTAIVPGRALIGYGLTQAAPPAGDLGVSGKVGVGTASPQAKLHVNQAGAGWQDGLMLQLGPTRNRSVMFQETESGNLGQLRFRNYQDQGGLYGGYEFTDHTGAAQVRVLDSGYTGFGTAQPAERVHIVGNLRVDGNIIASGGGGGLTLPATPNAQMPCDGSHGGTIYWSADDGRFYGCNGTALIALDGAKSSKPIVFSCTPSDWSQAFSGSGTWSSICSSTVEIPYDSVVLMSMSGHMHVDSGWCYLSARIGGQDWNGGNWGSAHTYMTTWHPVGYAVTGELPAGTHTVQFGGLASNTCYVNGTVLHGIAIPKAHAKALLCQQAGWSGNPAASSYTSLCDTTVTVPDTSVVWAGINGHWNSAWCYLSTRFDGADWYSVAGSDPWGAAHTYYTNWHPIGGAITGTISSGSHSFGYGTRHASTCYVNGARQDGLATWAPGAFAFDVRQTAWSHSGAGGSWTTIASQTVNFPKSSAVYLGVSGHWRVDSSWCYMTALVDGVPLSPTGDSPTWKWGASHTYMTNWHPIGYATTVEIPAGSHTISYAVLTAGNTCWVNGTRLWGFAVPL